MGKRKHHDEEEYLARKTRKLEKKMLRLRRKQRNRRSLSSSSNQSSELLHEAPQNEGAPRSEDYISSGTSPRVSSPFTDVRQSLPTSQIQSPNLASVVLPATSCTTAHIDLPTQGASAETIQGLEPDILCLLGDEPSREEQFGPNVHKDIACRWSDILINGLKDETKNDILKDYNVPDNMKLVQPPILNPEIKAAVNESALKRDIILADKQKLLTSVITCVPNTLTLILTTGSYNDDVKNQTLKSLSDAGRLLCHIHYNETQTRRHFLLSCLNKEIRDNVKDLKRDLLLFGNELQDNLKSMKATRQTGAELKPKPVKPKLPNKNLPKQSRALNWRGPPPPQSQPRRVPARHSSTVGGCKQQPTRRPVTDQRARPQRSQARTSLH